MTLREFLDAAYALLIAEHQRLGVHLTDALTEAAMWRDGGQDKEDPAQPVQQRVQRSVEEVTAAKNDQALAMLQGMLAGAKHV